MVYRGTTADPQRYLHHVQLQIYPIGGSPVALCGGTLVSATQIITAAHCLDGNIDFVSVLSSDEFLTAPAVSWEVSPAYDPDSPQRWQWDVGTVFLRSPLLSAPYLSPDFQDHWGELPDRAPLTLVGRGLVCGSGGPECVSRTLMSATLPKVQRSRCIGANPWQWYEKTVGNALCAGGGEPFALPEACPGDSGGGLFSGSILYGAVSAGDASNGACTGTFRPTLFSGMYFNANFFGAAKPRTASVPLPLPVASAGTRRHLSNGKFMIVFLVSHLLFF
jgi:hypothetical protein